MSKRFRLDEPPDTKRIPASLDYEEWFEIRLGVGMDELASIDRSTPAASLLGTFAMLITDWSLTDGNGEKLPITLENIKEVNRRGLLANVFTEMQALPFFIQMSRQPSTS